LAGLPAEESPSRFVATFRGEGTKIVQGFTLSFLAAFISFLLDVLDGQSLEFAIDFFDLPRGDLPCGSALRAGGSGEDREALGALLGLDRA
jgi:hypothetical protein